MGKVIFCDNCGCEIHNLDKCKMYRAGGPYYETIYICEDCSSNKATSEEMEEDGFQHVDMDDGVIL